MHVFESGKWSVRDCILYLIKDQSLTRKKTENCILLTNTFSFHVGVVKDALYLEVQVQVWKCVCVCACDLTILE